MAEFGQKFFSIFVLFYGLQLAEGGNILILEGVYSNSHHLWMKHIALELVKEGHNVTFLCTHFDNDVIPNLSFIHLEKIDEIYRQKGAEDADIFTYSDFSIFTQFYYMMEFFNIMSKHWVSNGFQSVMDYPKDFKFDLIIWDHLCSPGLLIFTERFPNTPVISASAYPVIYVTNSLTGSPYYPSFIPNQSGMVLKNGYLDRFINYILFVSEHFYINYYLFRSLETELKTNYTNMRPLKDLMREVKVHLVNYHPALDFVQPIMPSVIPVGGLQIHEPKPLPKDLEEVVQKSKKGVVLFALGTTVRPEVLGLERLNEIIGALRELPDYTFLWKLNDTKIKLDLPENVIIRKWLPQNDILAHKKTVLFISHGGALSTQEATWFGVPMLGLPVMVDQFTNLERSINAGMATFYRARTVKKESFKKAILDMLNNEVYTINAKTRSKNYRRQRETPMKRAMWWINYVMENPDLSHLKSPAIDINYFVKHSIDVIAPFVLLVSVIVYFILKLIVKTISKICCHEKAKDNKKKKT